MCPFYGTQQWYDVYGKKGGGKMLLFVLLIILWIPLGVVFNLTKRYK